MTIYKSVGISPLRFFFSFRSEPAQPAGSHRQRVRIGLDDRHQSIRDGPSDTTNAQTGHPAGRELQEGVPTFEPGQQQAGY